MGPRKYRSEFSINMFAPNPVVIQPQHLEEKQVVSALQESPCHIYMICSRPRIRFNPKSFRVEGGKFNLSIEVLSQEDATEVQFSLITNEHFKLSRVRSTYPYNEIEFLDDSGG